MTTLQKMAVGVCIILAAICGFIAATLDGNPDTNVSISETMSKVNEGIGVIRSAKETTTITPESSGAAPAETSDDITPDTVDPGPIEVEID